MIKLQKNFKSVLLLILICISSFKCQEEDIYQKLKKMAENQNAGIDPSIGSDGTKREISKEDRELYTKVPVAPMFVRRFFCDIDVKLNTVKQDVMKNHNYQKIMYRYNTFLLYVSANWCDYCCQHEKELHLLKDLLSDKRLEGEEIPIVQLHSDTDVEALKELKIGFFKVPSLYFVRNKRFYQYNSFFRADNILRFINNIVNPVLTLDSVEEVENFLDTSKQLEEKSDFLSDYRLQTPEEFDQHYRIRTIGFFSEVEEYSAEFTQFHDYADKVAYRPDLRFAVVTNPDLVRHFKGLYDGIWFNSHSLNSIVMKRIEKVMYLDLSLLNEMLEVFMVYNSIPFLDELSMNNNDIVQNIVTPIALFFIDSSYILPNYHSTIKFLINLSKRYLGKYVFMFMDGNTKNKSKEQVGLKKDAPLPTLVINYIKSGKTKALPFTTPFNDVEIMKFLDENYNAKASTSYELDDLREKIVTSFDEKIVKNLKLATKIERKNFEKIIVNKKYDVVMFVIDTDYDKESEKISKYINKVCERFKSLGIKSVLFTYYDVNENGPLLHGTNRYNVKDIVIFPNKTKRQVKFQENLTLLRLMKFVEKNANTKIRLPDTPHIDLELQGEYYNKKAVLESYEENFDKNELQIDDLISMDFEKAPKTEL